MTTDNPLKSIAESDDSLIIAGKTVKSRLITGSGKYSDDRIIKDVLEAAECDIIRGKYYYPIHPAPGRRMRPSGLRGLPGKSDVETG